MVKLTDEQYLAYRKAHACPIPKEDLEAQMFIGETCTVNTSIGMICTENNVTQMPRINNPDTFIGYERCSQPGCTGLSENVKYSEDSSKYNTML